MTETAEIRRFRGDIQHTRGTRQSVTVEMVEERMPTPESLLAAALSEKPRPIGVCAGDYAPVVHELRGKGYTWAEVAEWLAKRGLVFSQAAINSAYRKRFGKDYR